MKKILFFILVLITAVMFTGCGSKNNTAGADENGTEQVRQGAENDEELEDVNSSGKEPSGFAFEHNGVKIYMNTDAEPIINALGEPLHYFEAESCAFKGLDKTYTYAGFEITTYPMDGKDYISSVYLMDDTVSTPEGIYIGSSVDDMITAYGNDYTESSGSYTYIKDDSKLQFIVKNGEIASITYLAVVEGME